MVHNSTEKVTDENDDTALVAEDSSGENGTDDIKQEQGAFDEDNDGGSGYGEFEDSED